MLAQEQIAHLLDRIIRFKDYTPFVLICDSLSRPSNSLVSEFVKNVPQTYQLVKIFTERADNAEKSVAPDKIIEYVNSFPATDHRVILIDHLGRIPDIGNVLQTILRPGVCVLGVYHEDLEPEISYYPRGAALLSYMATCIVKCVIDEDVAQLLVEDDLSKFEVFPSRELLVDLTVRRKSGNATFGRYRVDTITHTTEYLPTQKQREEQSEALLEGLTTFNLGITEKQKQDRENVDLPFLAAQEIGDGGASGGAIVYEFEKEDDFDEDEPFEDGEF